LVLDLLRACFPGERDGGTERSGTVAGTAGTAGMTWTAAPGTAAAAGGAGAAAAAAAGGAAAAAARQQPLTTAAAAARQAALLKADLIHNPRRFEGWLALADHLDAVKDLALNDAAKLVPVSQWRASSEAEALVERLQLGLRRACCAAVAAAPTEADRAAAYERAGLAAYELVQEAPPFHDGRRARRAHNGRWRAALGLSREAFDGAASCAPAEWTYKCYGAKVVRKIDAPGGERDLFDRLAATTKCAPGNLEAFYQMHTTRWGGLYKFKSVDP
jgi:calcineurin-binding protein cabin-1